MYQPPVIFLPAGFVRMLSKREILYLSSDRNLVNMQMSGTRADGNCMYHSVLGYKVDLSGTVSTRIVSYNNCLPVRCGC